MAAPTLGGLLGLVFAWLYFALQESSARQATLGKRALGIKVVDESARRIGFGRATGRFFGKIISSILFGIGFFLAGWTAKKQALHDMMAGTYVVFTDVAPGQPLPSLRPPMPWYGWLLNILLIGAIVLFFVACFVLFNQLIGAFSPASSGGL
jgi:hypothetical protein